MEVFEPEASLHENMVIFPEAAPVQTPMSWDPTKEAMVEIMVQFTPESWFDASLWCFPF